MDNNRPPPPPPRHQWSAPQEILDNLPKSEVEEPELLFQSSSKTISARESSYHARRHQRTLSPDRADAFSSKNTEDARTYTEVMREQQFEHDKNELLRKLQKIERESKEMARTTQEPRQYQNVQDDKTVAPATRDLGKRGGEEDVEGSIKRRRWDQTPLRPSDEVEIRSANETLISSTTPASDNSRWDQTPQVSRLEEPQQLVPDDSRPAKNRWDQTPIIHNTSSEETPSRSRWDRTPAAATSSRWDQTPVVASGLAQNSAAEANETSSGAETPRKSRSRWDETPMHPSVTSSDSSTLTPAAMQQQHSQPLSAEVYNELKWERELDSRNKPWTEEDLDRILPAEGYKAIDPPENYQPIATPQKLTHTPARASLDGFHMQDAGGAMSAASLLPLDMAPQGDLPYFKPEDIQYFGRLLEPKHESELTFEEAKERKLLQLLIRIKNGIPQMRRVSMRQLTVKARDFGAPMLFNHILPLLMSPTLEDQGLCARVILNFIFNQI